MLHLVVCFSVWSIIFTYLFWRLFTVTKDAVTHLQLLHRIPCSKCAYFTGDYRLKCTVNPTTAMSQTAIGCRDFISENRANPCSSCTTANLCGNSEKKDEMRLNSLLFR